MHRVREAISALLGTSTAILAIAACASAATPLPPGRAGCEPRGTHTLAADRVALVFSWHSSIYGCVAARSKRRKLGSAGFCNLAPGRVAPVSVAGQIVAYGLERCGVDTGSSTVVVLDLATGARLAALPAAGLPLGPESFVSVGSLVVRAGGAVGWIVGEESVISHRPATYEVHRSQAGQSSLLDAGPAILPGSLSLAGSRMTWRDGAVTRSARLS